MVVDAAAPAEIETVNQEELDVNCESCLATQAESSITDTETTESVHSDSTAAIETHLIIIDSRIENYEQLLENLVSDGSIEYQVAVLNEQTDGVQQITDLLAGQQSYGAIHIASHGSAGSLQLGSTTINAENLSAYQSQFSAWSQNLSEDADILLYGCDVAGSLEGQWLVNQIGEWSGADVAASDDLTGHADLGGDWDFEYIVGVVETNLAFSIDVQENWNGTLESVTVTTLDDVVDRTATSVTDLINDPGADGVISLREAIIAANNNPDADVIYLGAGVHTLSITTGTGDAGGDLDINENVHIIGLADGSSVVDASDLTDPGTMIGERVFDVVNESATFQYLTVTGGSTSTFGAGIRVGGGTSAIIDNVVVTDNHSLDSGGGISNAGTLTVTNSCLLYTSPSPRDRTRSRMPSSA